jgi:hypothetical protein
MAEVALVAEWRRSFRHFRHFRHLFSYIPACLIFEKSFRVPKVL